MPKKQVIMKKKNVEKVGYPKNPPKINKTKQGHR